MNNNYAKAYTEVLEILNYLPLDEYERIQKDKIKFFREHCDLKHNFIYDVSKPLEQQNFLRETHIIITELFLEYFATQQQKDKINTVLLANEEKHQAHINELYNINNLFNRNGGVEQSNSKNLPIEIEENRVFKMIISFFKKIFSKKF